MQNAPLAAELLHGQTYLRKRRTCARQATRAHLETCAMSYLHLGDGSLRRVVEVAQSIQLPGQLAEEMLELVLEVLLRVILRYPHRLLQELHGIVRAAEGRR